MATNASWSQNTSGDWNTAASWTGGLVPGSPGASVSGDTATFSASGSYTVTVAAAAPWSIGSIAMNAAGAALVVGSGGLALSGTASLASGTLLLGGVLTGGTVVQSGGTLAVQDGSYSATLNSVTVDGTLNLSGAGLRLGLVGTNRFLNASGTGPGRIVLTGAGTTLSVTDSEALSNVAVVFGSASTSAAVLQLGSYFNQSLTLGSNVTVSVTGYGLISNIAQTVTKQVSNAGTISIAAGAMLEVGPKVQLASSGSGAVAIAAGGTLLLDDTYTASALRSLIKTNAGTVAIGGLLDNTGNTLTLAPGGTMPSLAVKGGTLRGGTVKLSGGSLSLLAGGNAYAPIASTLDGVTLQGTLDLSAASSTSTGTSQVLFKGGLVLQDGAGTGPGTILLTGAGQSLLATDGETLDNVSISLGNAARATTLGATTSGSLVLGKRATVSVRGLATISGGSFINGGTVQVSSGSRVVIASGTTIGSSSGSLTLAAGSTLEVDGTVSSGSLAKLVTAGSGVVELDGTVNNVGQALSVQQGPLGMLLLRGGMIQGGAVQVAGGMLQFAAGKSGNAPVLSGVALQGTLDLSQPLSGQVGAYVGLQNGVSYGGAGGSGRGAIQLTGAGSELRALDAETLANVAVTLGSSASLAASVLGTASSGGFTLGPTSTIAVTGRGLIGGSGSFTNNGSISIARGARLDIGPSVVLGVSTGTITVAAGGTLAIGGSLTTAALLGLGISGAGVVALDGLLDNSAGTLQLQPGGPFASLTLEGGTILGGTLLIAGGTLCTSAAPGESTATLSGVTVQGVLKLSLPPSGIGAPLEIVSGTTFTGLSGTGPGSVVLTTPGQALLVGDTETLDNVAITLGSGARLGGTTGNTLTLGAGFTLDDVGGGFLTGGRIVNAGTIIVEANQVLHVDAGFSNEGALTVAYGGQVLVGGTTTLDAFTTLAASLSGSGTLGVDIGGVLELGGGRLGLLAGGRLDGSLLQGTIRNGTVAASAGVTVSSLTLDDITWIGTLAASGSGLALLDGTVVQGADGGAGLIDATRLAGVLTMAGSFDQVTIQLGGGTLQSSMGGAQLGAGTTLSLGAGASVAGSITDAGSVTLAGARASVSSLVSTGTISVTGGTLAASNLVNAGTITLSASSTLQLAAATALGGVVAFGTGNNRLAFTTAGYDGATLSGFRYGDSIDLGGLPYGNALALSLVGSTLQVLKGGTAVASFGLQTMPGALSYSASQFELRSDGAGGTLLTTQYRPSAPVWTGPGGDFDTAYYLAQYPDAAKSGLDPLTHYLNVGWKQGLNPNAWFNTSYYLNQNSDVARAGVNPLVHYASSGWKEGRDPSILFSTRGYLAAYPDVAAAGMDPLHHFLLYGQFEGRTPVSATARNNAAQDPLVQGAWYFAQYPDAAASGLDPTQHYNQIGWKQGYNPDPWFDTKYYLTANPDIAKAGVNPLQHFEAYGAKEGRQPSLAFNDAAYLQAYPDVAKAGINPLLHYITYGQLEGRMRFITAPVSTMAPDPLVDRNYYFAQLATIVPASASAFTSYDQQGWKLGLNPDPWFDTKYYLAQNPSVARSGVDPLVHFETVGWKQGLNPSAGFSVAKYLAAYPSVAASNVNPLLQFITQGQSQGMQAFRV